MYRFIIILRYFYKTFFFSFIQAKEDYEREQRRKERRIESGESSWMLPSLSDRLTAEDESNDKVVLLKWSRQSMSFIWTFILTASSPWIAKVCVEITWSLLNKYRRIPKVTAPVTFEFCRQKGPLLTGSRYFRVAVIFGQLKNVCNSKWTKTRRTFRHITTM